MQMNANNKHDSGTMEDSERTKMPGEWRRKYCNDRNMKDKNIDTFPILCVLVVYWIVHSPANQTVPGSISHSDGIYFRNDRYRDQTRLKYGYFWLP